MADAAAKQKEDRKKRAAAARDNTKILSAGPEVQRDEASKALLREFMHSKKLTSTLATFDQEQPRGELTIQSRALVAQILAAEEWAKANKASATPLKTLLEVVCSHRLFKTEQQKELTAKDGADAALSDSDEESYLDKALREKVERRNQLREDIEKKREELDKVAKKVETLTAKREKKAGKKGGKKKKTKEAAGSSDDEESDKKKKKKKKGDDGGKDKKKKKKMLSFDELLEVGEQKSKKKNKKAADGAGGTKDGAVDWSEYATKRTKDDDVDPVDTEHAYRDEVRRAAGLDAGSPPPPPTKRSQQADEGSSGSNDDGSSDSDSASGSDDSEESFGQQVRNAAKAEKEQAAKFNTTMKQQGGKNMNWDVDDMAVEDDVGGGGFDEPPLTAGAAKFNTPMSMGPSDDIMDMGGSSVFAGGMGSLGRPIDARAGEKLRQLLIGSAHFPESWCNQGFYYSDQVAYGLVQNNGGPCGVVAVVQARVVRSLFLEQKVKLSGDPTDPSSISDADKDTALVAALADTLSTVAGGGGVSLALPPDLSERPRMAVDFDGWRVQSIGRNKAAIRAAIRENLEFFTARRGLGMVAFIVSAIYTKGGIDAVRGEMDAMPGSEGCLVVCHQYTSQELVSLLLHGHSTSNVFNGVKDMGNGADRLVLRGCPNRSEIGLLTYQEYTRDIEVGSFLKDPDVPVWTIWNESHYTVCFAKAPLSAQQPVVELYYYDPLGCQDEEYHLTVDTTRKAPERGPNDLIPYMDDILRTRSQWAGAHVDWNGSEGLL